MTCPDAKTWGLLSMDLLDEDQAESLRRHSVECERCHDAWLEVSGQHTDLLNAFQAFDCNHDQRRDQLMTMLPKAAPLSKKESRILHWRRWIEEGGIAMTLQRHKTRWAAIASLAAACILLVFFFTTGEKIAFADVLQTMRQAKSMACDFVTTTTVVEGQLPDDTTKKTQRGTHSMILDGPARAELSEYEQAGKKSRLLFLGDKAFLWFGDQVQVVSFANVSQYPDSGDLLSRLLKVTESPDRELGEQTINGRRTVGFEIAGWRLGYGTRPTKASPTPDDSACWARVWVDVEHNLPTRVEFQQKMASPNMTGTIHQQWDNIRWNEPIDAAKFRPPSSVELAKARTIQVPTIDEAAFVDGMRAWLELKDEAQAGIDTMKKKSPFKGGDLPPPIAALIENADLDAGYPKRLDQSWLLGTFGARAGLASLARTLPQLKTEPIPDDVDEQKRKEIIRARARESAKTTGAAGAQAFSDVAPKAAVVSAFYQMLANQQRDPEYFGATVKPGDAEAILLKWRIDDDQYRVIYGDLRAATVDISD